MTILTLSIELTNEQAIGIAQARTLYNRALPEGSPHLTDIEYMTMVNIGAANSYVSQYSGSELVLPSPTAPVPRKIDARRLRLALLQLNLLNTVEDAINSQGSAAQIEWQFATNISEDYPLVVALATALDFNINEIFDLAETYA